MSGRRLRVAVDATAIPGQRLGVGVYVTELLRHVADAADIHVFAKERDAAEFGSLMPSVTVHPVRLSNRAARIAWTHLVLGRRLARVSPDVFWGPHYEVPSGLRCPAVVTFHDPTFFTLPEIHERAKVAYFTRVARTGIRRAARVIAVSGFAKRGAVEHAGADPSRTHVVHEGIDLDRYKPAPDPRADEPFVFFVGALAPHKDVPSLVRAFDGLGTSHRLVIAGPRAWGAAAVDEAIASAESDAITCVGYVSEDDKIRYLQRASAFVYPSIAEGFGLPVLEALACGAPTIATTGSAPEEFARDAAVLVPPRDTDALRDALRRVLHDPALADDLRAKGPQRAASFGWERAASETLDVWRMAAAG